MSKEILLIEFSLANVQKKIVNLIKKILKLGYISISISVMDKTVLTWGISLCLIYCQLT